MNEKSDSKWLSLATVSILGQAPRREDKSKPETSHIAMDGMKCSNALAYREFLFIFYYYKNMASTTL